MTFLVNLMFSRLDKFDGPIFEEKGGDVFTGDGGGEGAYVWDVNWVTYLGGGVYWGGLIHGSVLTVFYGILYKSNVFQLLWLYASCVN